MATYAIGDIQGCLSPLKKLLEKIEFNPEKDTLWFTGDLVNRGPQSLEALRFIKQLGKKHLIVLGNHDLHLLALAHAGLSEESLQPILEAPDRQELLDWLTHQPLLIKDQGYVMVHAGVAPDWDINTAQKLAKEVEVVIQNKDTAADFFKHMYGNKPDLWDPTLTGWDRLRCITNYFTRVRFCDETGRLNLDEKGTRDSNPDLIPWFKVPNRKTANDKIIFGHWAALSGKTDTENVYALDTGCVWGFCLTAMRLEDKKIFSIQC